MIPITRYMATGAMLAMLILASSYWGDCAAAKTTAIEPAVATSQKSNETAQDETGAKAVAERWGVEVLAVRRAAAGHMLDFRYRVLDAKKAAPLFVRQTKPYLIHQRSGKALGVPETAKLGPLRNSNTPQAGRIYWMFFANPGRFVQVGDKVTVSIGDFQVVDMLVE